MQHRIFLVPHRGDPEVARSHWERRHGDLFTATPGLLGYTQNRPVDQEWDRRTARFCSETWFADRDAEREAYASTYYRDVVAPDEASFLDRESAWASAVLGDSVPVVAEGVRVLWFDESPPPGASWVALDLARPVPVPGKGKRVHVAVVDGVAEALSLTRGAGVSLVCRSMGFAIPQRSV
ncbi:EthD domain-containing protein [Saccharomonospora sp. NPDC006951]